MLEENFNVMYSLRYTKNVNVKDILMNCFRVISPAKECQDDNQISFGRISAGGSNHIKQRLVSPNMEWNSCWQRGCDESESCRLKKGVTNIGHPFLPSR